MINEVKALREKLAAAHHIIQYYGWDDLLATHLSARIPGTDQLLITPLNVLFEKVTPENLIHCDLSGNLMELNDHDMMPQAINIHAGVYRNNKQVMSVFHTHSDAGVAVASLDSGLLFVNQRSLRFYGDVAYHDYDGLALDDEGEQIARSLQDKRVMLLRNHGLLSTGATIEEACYLQYYLEKTCRLQLEIMAAGSAVIPIDEEVCLKTKAQFDTIHTYEKEFQALVSRVNDSYS